MEHPIFWGRSFGGLAKRMELRQGTAERQTPNAERQTLLSELHPD
jgi:hypothetical protein